MNLKHEMFWNLTFNIIFLTPFYMNLKHEMFWNGNSSFNFLESIFMNLKHEMFWNEIRKGRAFWEGEWTLNMKCFEIFDIGITS